ncbi:MAG: hypothetical protein JNK14_11105 [Chitinophagaceae bacterium]|nr:hypothetical protein [Chitinophagaceae bacterium]
MTIFYLHWNEKELKERVQPLRQLKHTIDSHWSSAETVKFGDTLPDIFIISLDRLPSHGRQYAQWLWEAKKRQHIPIVFVDGKPEKVEETKQKFPKAVYCTADTLLDTISKISVTIK